MPIKNPLMQTDIFQEVIKYLDYKSVSTVRLVCKQWKRTLEDIAAKKADQIIEFRYLVKDDYTEFKTILEKFNKIFDFPGTGDLIVKKLMGKLSVQNKILNLNQPFFPLSRGYINVSLPGLLVNLTDNKEAIRAIRYCLQNGYYANLRHDKTSEYDSYYSSDDSLLGIAMSLNNYEIVFTLIEMPQIDVFFQLHSDKKRGYNNVADYLKLQLEEELETVKLEDFNQEQVYLIYKLIQALCNLIKKGWDELAIKAIFDKFDLSNRQTAIFNELNIKYPEVINFLFDNNILSKCKRIKLTNM